MLNSLRFCASLPRCITCAHKVPITLVLMAPPRCTCGQGFLQSSKAPWPKSSHDSTRMPPKHLKSSAFQTEAVLLSLSHTLSPAGFLILVLTRPSIQLLRPKPWSQSLPLPLSLSQQVGFIGFILLLNSFLFVARTATEAPKWSPTFQSPLVNPSSYSCWNEQFPASNGLPSPTKSSSNSYACLPKPFMN